MASGYRVCRTLDGRHVLETHPDAAFLVYRAHDVLPAAVVAELFPAPAVKPVRKTTKPRRASTKEA
jgi:hypothetical protein